MLEANKDYSKAILESSLIKLTRVNGFIKFSLNFKHIVMVNYNASESNPVVLRLVRTEAVTTGDKKSTIILKMCQVKRGGTLSFILTIFCLL
jgi:hypothetical protein